DAVDVLLAQCVDRRSQGAGLSAGIDDDADLVTGLPRRLGHLNHDARRAVQRGPGLTTPIVAVLRVTRARAARLGRKPRADIAHSTLSRVAGRMFSFRLITRETV